MENVTMILRRDNLHHYNHKNHKQSSEFIECPQSWPLPPPDQWPTSCRVFAGTPSPGPASPANASRVPAWWSPRRIPPISPQSRPSSERLPRHPWSDRAPHDSPAVSPPPTDPSRGRGRTCSGDERFLFSFSSSVICHRLPTASSGMCRPLRSTSSAIHRRFEISFSWIHCEWASKDTTEKHR